MESGAVFTGLHPNPLSHHLLLGSARSAIKPLTPICTDKKVLSPHPLNLQVLVFCYRNHIPCNGFSPFFVFLCFSFDFNCILLFCLCVVRMECCLLIVLIVCSYRSNRVSLLLVITTIIMLILFEWLRLPGTLH